jgi:hypothetical protein
MGGAHKRLQDGSSAWFASVGVRCAVHRAAVGATTRRRQVGLFQREHICCSRCQIYIGDWLARLFHRRPGPASIKQVRSARERRKTHRSGPFPARPGRPRPAELVFPQLSSRVGPARPVEHGGHDAGQPLPCCRVAAAASVDLHIDHGDRRAFTRYLATGLHPVLTGMAACAAD